ncbi:MAG: BamA/TamA family outer membrane protein [Bacteroidetes bacterium]|nr:BamA/TamA family outer membrane protein [Bacteroidota bacterium]MBP7399086.1 BamA/TamA family outer membrane protein [Chitinophagales bacterium]MBK7110215.1 BamA/TamA family outer membrane protein [Bacteroidota bacterium]MBK8487053.1 BamA/TamA family outer membrane protein [Bacteroidota bacterium]MBK8680442.1 BamA/TamA family outer membrane protein [Bacteroidota bacterium]
MRLITSLNSFKLFYLPTALICVISFSYSQSTDTLKVETEDCQQEELGDVLRGMLNKPPKIDTTSKSASLILLPIIGSNPATGFMVGVGGQFAFQTLGSELYSLLSGSLQLTTKGQFLILLKNNIYTKNERIFLSGDWRYQIFSQSTYGLGTNAPDGGVLDYQYSLANNETAIDSFAQPMTFDFLRFHQSVLVKIKPKFYLGLGYYFDGYYKIVDQKLNLTPDDTLITSHYAYNTYYDFNTSKYFSSAININVLYDSRDNMINSYKGYYARASWRGAFEFLGNEVGGNVYEFEYRSFHSLSKHNPRHLIAFWMMANFSDEGTFPYMVLPATAYDQRGRSARGYTQGRFRGNDYVYLETEYRFPITKCNKVLGGVVFANATSTNGFEDDPKLFESIKPGYGAGLRIMVDKQSKTNLAVDFGFGEKSFGFYLAASETF